MSAKTSKSKKQTVKKSTHASLFLLFIATFAIAIGFALCVMIHNQDFSNISAGNSENISASLLSFEGLHVGDQITDELANTQVLDANYNYLYNDIAVTTDARTISGLAFYTISDGAENITTSIDDVAIAYKKYPLKTVEDFNDNFGKGEVIRSHEYTYTSYDLDDYKLSLLIKNDTIYNVVLEQKQ